MKLSVMHVGFGGAVLAGLAFLEDNQVRNRPGRGSCLRDSSDEGDGCRGRINVNLPCRENIGLPGCPVRTVRPATGDELESERLKAKLGEMLLERELLEAKIAALEANRPLARRRSRP